MAHFAEIDKDGSVLRIVVVSNDKIQDESGAESEAIGAAFCRSLLGAETFWVQTSYNGNFRKNYAGIGYTYDADRDAFISPQPYPSWLLNEETCLWESPVPYPDDGERYVWDEAKGVWVLEELIE